MAEVTPTVPDDLALPSIEELNIDVSREALPSFEDNFIQQYIAGRDAFLEREEATRSDYSFRQSLNPLAQEACKIVDRIRSHEYKSIWTATTSSASSPKEDEVGSHVYPGMPFRLARKQMEESKLWQIVKRMPKGCLLHSHFDAMVDLSWLVEQALKIPGYGFSSNIALDSEKALETATVKFQYYGEDKLNAAGHTDAFTSDYVPNGLMTIQKAASAFKPTNKFRNFTHWLCSRNTITTDEALSPEVGTAAIWAKFASCFQIYNEFLCYEPIFRAALQRLFSELAADGIRWAEFRCCFLQPYQRENQSVPEQDFMHFFIAFDQELGKFQDTPEGQNFWGARFIWTSIRSFEDGDIQQNMTECIRHKAMFPHLIAGYDLVGHEDKGRPLRDLLPLLFWFRKASAAAELNIPFVFHAGETVQTGSEVPRNMYDAVLLGTRRIGHGYALYKHPLLLETVKSKNICIESCPLSNEVLRMTSSIMAHPLSSLIAKGVKCVVSNDDPSILGGPEVNSRNGSSCDMLSLLQAWDDLGLAGLGSLALDSVRFALFEVPDTVDESTKDWTESTKKGLNGNGLRGDRMREWRKDWDDFIEWILLEYAADWGTDE